MKANRTGWVLASRLFGEFLVIVIGVLVALAADAWWNSQKEARYENEVLADLMEEFSQNQSQLQADIAVNDSILSAYRGLANMPSDVWRGFGIGSLAAEFAMAWQIQARFDATTGAVRSLIDGGELTVISNRELRQLIAAWPDLVTEAGVNSSQGGSFLLNHGAPFMLEVGVEGMLTEENRGKTQRLMGINALLLGSTTRSMRRLEDHTARILAILEAS